MTQEGREPSDNRVKKIDARLKELNQRMGRTPSGSETERPVRSGYGQAFRLSSEFISAILVGLAIGYGLDLLFGTKPWAMIVLLLLGFAAGVMNVLRAAESMSREDREDDTQPGGDRDES